MCDHGSRRRLWSHGCIGIRRLMRVQVDVIEVAGTKWIAREWKSVRVRQFETEDGT
jgi:hypothetical protein